MQSSLPISTVPFEHLCRALRPAALATSLFLLTLFAGCSYDRLLIRPELPPASLTQLCDEGPLPVDGDITLTELSRIILAREKAAEECRNRFSKLVDWSKAVTRK